MNIVSVRHIMWRLDEGSLLGGFDGFLHRLRLIELSY
jgi:hypothetical protein